MGGSLEGVRAKMGRAHAHLDELKVEIRSFLDSEPYSIIPEHDSDMPGGVDRIRWTVRENGVGSPPLDISLIAGEAVHQMRSALDHLVCQLVIQAGNGARLKTSRSHGFPVFKTREGYQTHSGNKVDGVSAAPLELIDSFQPYHGPSAKGDLLWLLHEPSNTDKHRLIPVSVIAVDRFAVLTSRDDITYADVLRTTERRVLEHGDVVATSFGHETHTWTEATSLVAFQQVAGFRNEALVPLMSQLLGHASNIVDAFDRFFP